MVAMSDPRDTPAPASGDSRPEEGPLLSAQARFVVVLFLGMLLTAAVIANWYFVFLAPVLIVWFSVPYLFAVGTPEPDGAAPPAPDRNDS